jgi:hypothetical protein
MMPCPVLKASGCFGIFSFQTTVLHEAILRIIVLTRNHIFVASGQGPVGQIFPHLWAHLSNNSRDSSLTRGLKLCQFLTTGLKNVGCFSFGLNLDSYVMSNKESDDL